tara:strand:- start:44 stop:1543 length:1500 start_codon:yes stop_codon:yes gene_type:complete
MSLQGYVHQLRPRKESYVNHVDKIQSFLSEAFNIGIVDNSDIPKDVTSNQDLNQLKAFFNYLKGLKSVDIPLIANEKGVLKIHRDYEDAGHAEEISDWLKEKGTDLNIHSKKYGTGSIGSGGTVRVHENTQEIMVAALCLMNKKFPEKISTVDAIELINSAKDKFNDVEGASLRPELLEQFNNNFKDLGTAISSANAIREIVGTISKAYWTGKGWHEDIAHLNPNVPGIKDYNSSDIVVKSGKVFYGFSLKKKARSKDLDPTLINKPITGDQSFLSNILGDAEMSVIESAKNALFKFIVKKHYNLSTSEVLKLPFSTRKRNVKSVTRYMKDIPKKKMDGYVRSSKNVFFKKVDNILMGGDYAQKFMVDFLKFVLKFDMPEKITQTGTEFEFYLLTGIGTLQGEEVVAEKANVKDLPQTIEVLSDLFKRDQLKLIRTKGRTGEPKLNAYQEGATAAKNFYTITDAGKDILDLEIRYKGEYTANPQFQCIVTPYFKNLFKE